MAFTQAQQDAINAGRRRLEQAKLAAKDGLGQAPQAFTQAQQDAINAGRRRLEQAKQQLAPNLPPSTSAENTIGLFEGFGKKLLKTLDHIPEGLSAVTDVAKESRRAISSFGRGAMTPLTSSVAGALLGMPFGPVGRFTGAATGAAIGSLVPTLTDLSVLGANKLFDTNFPTLTTQAIDPGLNYLGFPEPETQVERALNVAGSAAGGVGGTFPLFKYLATRPSLTPPPLDAISNISKVMAINPKTQAMGAGVLAGTGEMIAENVRERQRESHQAEGDGSVPENYTDLGAPVNYAYQIGTPLIMGLVAALTKTRPAQFIKEQAGFGAKTIANNLLNQERNFNNNQIRLADVGINAETNKLTDLVNLSSQNMLEQNKLAQLLKDLKIASVSGQANEPPIPPSNAVGRESQTLLKDSKTKIQQQHFEEKNGLLTNINDEINSAEAGGNFLSDQPDAVKLSASLENITSNNPIVRRPGAMFSEQIDRESFSFMKAVLTALQQKKVSLSEEEAIIAMNNGHVVEKKLPTPSVRQVGQPESSPSYEVTFKSGYQAVDEVRRLLGEVFGQNPIKGYSSIASATAQNLYNQLRAIQKNYLPEGVLDEYNTVIQRQIGEMSAFERGGGSGGNLVRNGDVENFSLSPFQSLKNIFDDGDVSFSNYAKLAGNESAADAFRSVIFQKIQGLNPKEIQSVLRDSKVQDIRDNLSNLGEVGDKLEKELKIFEANANIRNDTSDTQSQIKDLVNEQDRIKAKTSAAERALIQNEAIQRTQESQLNSLEMAKNTDELLAALGSNMQRNQNIPLKLGGKSIEKIGSQQNELVKALKIQKNLNRNKKIAATAAVTAAATAFAVDQKLFNNNSTK